VGSCWICKTAAATRDRRLAGVARHRRMARASIKFRIS
jgi:hypothetical protein